MTEIIERRWKCDYCGNVSPTFNVLEHDTEPTGWSLVNRGHFEDNKGGIYIITPLHFCTNAHKEAWGSKATEVLE